MAYRYGSSKERYNFFNGLTCLVKSLEGNFTTIDLRNDSFVVGKVEDVDGFMNVVLSDAIYTDANGREYSFESFFVHSRNIRYVHVPESMPIVDTIKHLLKKIGPKERKFDQQSTKKSYKTTRAMNRHLATVASLDKKSDDESAT